MIWIALGFFGLLMIVFIFSLCAAAGRLDKEEDVYLAEWEDLHGS